MHQWYITSHNSLVGVGAGTYCIHMTSHIFTIKRRAVALHPIAASDTAHIHHIYILYIDIQYIYIYIYISSFRDKFEYTYVHICVYILTVPKHLCHKT
jgi:hypothetical protein